LRTSAPKRRNQAYDQGFLEFWALYPRHNDKLKAQSAWRIAIRRATQSQILAHAKSYRDDPNLVPEFTKLAATWLKATEFTEPYVPLPSRLAPGIIPTPRRQSREDWEAERDALAAQVEP
jgi:hypothetical protein